MQFKSLVILSFQVTIKNYRYESSLFSFYRMLYTCSICILIHLRLWPYYV